MIVMKGLFLRKHLDLAVSYEVGRHLAGIFFQRLCAMVNGWVG